MRGKFLFSLMLVLSLPSIAHAEISILQGYSAEEKLALIELLPILVIALVLWIRSSFERRDGKLCLKPKEPVELSYEAKLHWRMFAYFLLEIFKLSIFTVGALAVALIKDNHKKGRSNSKKLNR